MNKKYFLVVAGCVALAASGCGKLNVGKASQTISMEKDVAQWCALQDTFSKGFNKIDIGGKTITLPCKIEDITGMGFETQQDMDYTMSAETSLQVSFIGEQKAKFFATVQAGSEDTKITDAEVVGISWDNNCEQDENMKFVGGVNYTSSESDVNNLLDNFTGDKQKKDYYTYLNSDLNMGMSVHYEYGKIASINVYCDSDPVDVKHSTTFEVPQEIQAPEFVTVNEEDMEVHEDGATDSNVEEPTAGIEEETAE